MKWEDIVIWILFILSIVIVLWYFFGNSPTLEEALLVLILTMLFITNTQVVKNGIRLAILEKRFNKLAVDFIKHINKKH